MTSLFAKVFRNIGVAFVHQGQYQDAIDAYETVLSGSPDFQVCVLGVIVTRTLKNPSFKQCVSNVTQYFLLLCVCMICAARIHILLTIKLLQTALNLVLCYYELGNVPRMRKVFQRMLNIPVRGMTEEENETEEETKQNGGLINHQQGRGGGGQEEASFYESDTLQQELRRRKRVADRCE